MDKKIEVQNNVKLINNNGKKSKKRTWKKPELKDVSGKIMAQPYIRFT